MRHKTKSIKEDEPQKVSATTQEKKTDTKPLDVATYVKFVKCVYSGPVKVNNAPSGKKYNFKAGQVLPVRSPEDYHHLMSLKRNPGPNCCGGAEPQARTYFDVVEMEA